MIALPLLIIDTGGDLAAVRANMGGMSTSARMADAAFNRAREGLRVLEDLARFILDDAEIAAHLKQSRHQLTGIAAQWPGPPVETARDTQGDVGTSISTSSEEARQDLQAIAAAAGHRATEAVRTLEELAKLESPPLASDLQSIRYGLYDLTASVQQRLPARPWPQWKLCVLLTESLCRHGWLQVAEAAIAGGADCLQLREKSLSTSELVARATHLIELARPRGTAVVVNDRVDVALAADADGVHVGQEDLSVAQVRAMAGDRLLVGATVRSINDVQEVRRDGATYCGIGPMYSSATKPDLAAAGLDRLRDLLPAVGSLPHLAIGGIEQANVSDVVSAGGRGIAVCGAICGSEDPKAATQAMVEAMDRANSMEQVVQDA